MPTDRGRVLELHLDPTQPHKAKGWDCTPFGFEFVRRGKTATSGKQDYRGDSRVGETASGTNIRGEGQL